MAHKKKRVWLMAGMVCAATAASAQSMAYPDSLRADTLREIVIEADDGIHVPISSSLKSSIQQSTDAHKYSLDGLLDRYAPLAKDYIMHPFGFAERKRAKKRKKVNKVLQQYDVISDPLKELLDSVATTKAIEPGK